MPPRKRRSDETGLEAEEAPPKKLKPEPPTPGRKRQPTRKAAQPKALPDWMQDSLFTYGEEEEEEKETKAKRRPASKRKMPKVQLRKATKKKGRIIES